MHWNERKTFSRWVKRCVRADNTDVLRIQVHLYVEEDGWEGWEDYDQMVDLESFEWLLRTTATGYEEMLDRPLVQVSNRDLQKPLADWHPVFLSTTTANLANLANLVYAISTTKYFPQRYLQNPLALHKSCNLCHDIARERGLLKVGRREKARARHAAAAPANEAIAPEAPSPPIEPTTSPANDMAADEAFARALQAEENGLRRRRRR